MRRGWIYGAAMLGLLVALVVLWLRDEPLNPQAQEWLKPTEGTSQAYVFLLGLDAAADQSPAALGQQRLQAHRQWRASHGFGEPQPASQHSAQLALPGEALCLISEPECLARLLGEAQVGVTLLEQHGLLLQRYQQLLALEDYRTLAAPSPDEPMPNIRMLESGNLLLAMRAVQQASQGQVDQARELLLGDIRQLRLWLAQADHLVLKVGLVRLLARDLDALAVLVRAGLIGVPAAQPALTPAERSLESSLRREFALVATGLLSLPAETAASASQGAEALAVRWLYRPQMSVNDSFAPYRQVAADSQLAAPAFLRQLRLRPEPEQSRWRQLRNPVGSVLLGVAMPDFHRYLARLHDLDAKLALFNVLGQPVPQAKNPYRPGQPARWNTRRQAYCFSGPFDDPQGLRCLPWSPPEG